MVDGAAGLRKSPAAPEGSPARARMYRRSAYEVRAMTLTVLDPKSGKLVTKPR